MTGKLIIGIGLCITIALAAFFPHVSWQLRRLLTWSDSGTSTEIERILAENELLKAELARLTPLAGLLPPQNEAVPQFAEVYSRYPFSTRHELVVAVGSTDGVRSGAPVFAPTNTASPGLIGIVTETRERSATVRTIFDPAFRTAVRIGANGADALLVGGPEPTVTLIPKDAPVQPGDIVIAASPELPIGTPFGTLGILEPANDQAFKNAKVVVSYDIAALRIVRIGATQTP